MIIGYSETQAKIFNQPSHKMLQRRFLSGHRALDISDSEYVFPEWDPNITTDIGILRNTIKGFAKIEHLRAIEVCDEQDKI